MSTSIESQLGEITGLLEGKGGNMNEATLLAMMNKGGLGSDNTLVLVLLLLMMRRGGFGDDVASTVNNQAIEGQIEAAINRAGANQAQFDAIKSAVAGNGASIKELAAMLNCDFNTLNSVVQDIRGMVGSVAQEIHCSTDKVMGAIASNGDRVINAICNAKGDILGAISTCCCNMREAISSLKNDMDKQFCDLRFQDQAAHNEIMLGQRDLKDLINQSNSQQLLAIQQTQQLIKDQAKDDEIARLNRVVDDANRSAQTVAIIAAIKADCGGTTGCSK